MKMTFDDRKHAISISIISEKQKNAGDITKSNCIVCRCADPSNKMPTETKAADWRKVVDKSYENVTR